MPTRRGAIRLFRLLGIDLFLHWSWFVVALFEIRGGMREYSSPVWNVFEYLTLFLIVTLHEFGHALACRQVGGEANQIVLWPFGGVAYVDPPPRPGATLWSIAAGPLVNVILLPILFALFFWARTNGSAQAMPDLREFITAIFVINLMLLVFNLLPIYPLDGGQIFRALMWFVIGRARSLWVATVLGLLGAAGLVGVALMEGSPWMGLLALFILLNCWGGFRYAQALLRVARLPRRQGFACPECKTAPPLGERWKCTQCERAFDTFETQAMCVSCGVRYVVTQCLHCGRGNPMGDWAAAPAAT